MSLHTIAEYRNYLERETGLQFGVAVEEESGREELVFSLQDLELFRMPPPRALEGLLSSLPPRLSDFSATLQQRLELIRSLSQRCSLDTLREVLRNFQSMSPQGKPEQKSPRSAASIADAVHTVRQDIVRYVLALDDLAVRQRLQQYLDMDPKGS